MTINFVSFQQNKSLQQQKHQLENHQYIYEYQVTGIGAPSQNLYDSMIRFLSKYAIRHYLYILTLPTNESYETAKNRTKICRSFYT